MSGDNYVPVMTIKPFWRWAVGPRDPRKAVALPFYTRRAAEAMLREIARELPSPYFDPPVLYRKRRGRRIEAA